MRYAVSWLLAVIAGYGVALAANIAIFRACDAEPCLAGYFRSSVPGWLALSVASLLIRNWGTRAKSALGGMALALALVLAGAPVSARDPMSWSTNTFPADFVILGLLQVPVRAAWLVVAPGSVIFVLPFLAFGAVCGAIAGSTSSAPPARFVRPAAAMLLLVGGLVAEVLTTPTVWSPRVHVRIARLELAALPGVNGNVHHSWARKQVHFTVRPPSNADQALDFYERAFSGWRRLDRSSEDAMWLDPTGTVFAWVVIPEVRPQRPSAERYATVALQDRDRALWQQRFRRTSSGSRVVDLVVGPAKAGHYR